MKRLLHAFKVPAAFLAAFAFLPLVTFLVAATLGYFVYLLHLESLANGPTGLGVIFGVAIFTTILAGWIVNKIWYGADSPLRVLLLSLFIAAMCMGLGSSGIIDGYPLLVTFVLAGAVVGSVYRYSNHSVETDSLTLSEVVSGVLGLGAIWFFTAALFSVRFPESAFKHCMSRHTEAEQEIANLVSHPASCASDSDCVLAVRIGQNPCSFITSKSVKSTIENLDSEVQVGDVSESCRRQAENAGKMKMPSLWATASTSFRAGNCSIAASGSPKCVENKCIAVP